MDSIDVFLKRLTTVRSLKVSELDLISAHCLIEVINEKDFYLSQNSISKRLGFVLEGVFKVSKTNHQGQEYIPYFITSGHFAVDVDSYFNQILSEENIIALTTCKVITITKESYTVLDREIPDFSKIIAQIKEKALVEKLKLKNEMLVDSAEVRYQKLIQRQPQIFQSIPQSQIAQYLGITQYTLSRIKSKA